MSTNIAGKTKVIKKITDSGRILVSVNGKLCPITRGDLTASSLKKPLKKGTIVRITNECPVYC